MFGIPPKTTPNSLPDRTGPRSILQRKRIPSRKLSGAKVHQYLEKEPKDPFSLIKEELEAGILSYDHEQPLGYLESLLDKLEISKYSQQLVFSTTSLQLSKISPEILEPSISTKTFTWDMFRAGKSRSSGSILKWEPSPIFFRPLMERKKHGTPRPSVPEDA